MDDSDLSLDCATCVAAGTTACGDCVVTHLLANDDGPIDFVVAPVISITSPIERAVELFVAAGLLDDPPVYVAAADFEQGAVVPVMP